MKIMQTRIWRAISLAFVLLAGLAAPGPARAMAFDRVAIAVDGQSAALWAEAGPGAALFRNGELRPAPDGVVPAFVLTIFAHPSGWIGVGASETGDGTTLFQLTADFSTGRSWDLDGIPAPGAVDFRDGTLYIAAADGQALFLLGDCLLADSCPLERAVSEVVTLYTPNLTAAAVDPASRMMLLAANGSSSLLVADLEQNKRGVAAVFSESPGLKTIEVASGAVGRPGRYYIGLPDAAKILTGNFDPDFRELRQSASISLEGFVSVPPPFLVKTGVSAEIATVPGVSAAAKVAASDDGKLLLVGSSIPDRVHVLSQTDTALSRISDVETTGPLVDLDVTSAGDFAAFLSQGGLMILGAAALIDSAGAFATRDSSGDDKLEALLTAAVQTRLAEEGFLGGVVDGIFGPATQAAIKRYAFSHRLELGGSFIQLPDRATKLSPELLGRLFVGHTVELPADFIARPEGQELMRAAFSNKLTQTIGVTDDWGGLLTTGIAPCVPQNKLPPEQVWSNIAPAAAVLAELQTSAKEVVVLSPAQSSGYVNRAGFAGGSNS